MNPNSIKFVEIERRQVLLDERLEYMVDVKLRVNFNFLWHEERRNNTASDHHTNSHNTLCEIALAANFLLVYKPRTALRSLPPPLRLTRPVPQAGTRRNDFSI